MLGQTQNNAGLVSASQPKVLVALDNIECNISDIVNQISNIESKLSLVLNGNVVNKTDSPEVPRALNPVPLADRLDQCNNRLLRAEAQLRDIISRIEV